MPFLNTNGIRLAYQRTGAGEAVLFINGSSAAGKVWTVHQTPALHQSGYETITFDNRGVPPSDVPPGRYSMDDMVGDTVGLIEALDLAPCRIVATSLGAMITQELAIRFPHLVRCAVLIATRARMDTMRRALRSADQSLVGGGQRPNARYEAVNNVLQMLSPATLNDDAAVGMWLELFELSRKEHAGSGGQMWVELPADHIASLRRVRVPCRVIAYADDLIAPPHLAAEVADAIPDCDLVEFPRCGHLGHLERPDEVNGAIIEFLDKHRY